MAWSHWKQGLAKMSEIRKFSDVVWSWFLSFLFISTRRTLQCLCLKFWLWMKKINIKKLRPSNYIWSHRLIHHRPRLGKHRSLCCSSGSSCCRNVVAVLEPLEGYAGLVGLSERGTGSGHCSWHFPDTYRYAVVLGAQLVNGGWFYWRTGLWGIYFMMI